MTQLKSRLIKTADALKRLYHCEKGAEGLEKLLIIGAIVIPLLAVLIVFRDRLNEWVRGAWSDVSSDAENNDTSPFD